MTTRSRRSRGIRNRSLTPTAAEQAFAVEYARLEAQHGHSRVGVMAYRRLHPGAKASTAAPEASRFLKKPGVQAIIRQVRAEAAKKVAAELGALAQELANIAFANPLDYLRVNEDGEPAIDLSRVTPEIAASISETVVEDFTDARGERKREVRRVKVKQHDKIAALRLLAQLGGHLRERVEHSGQLTLGELVELSMRPKPGPAQ